MKRILLTSSLLVFITGACGAQSSTSRQAVSKTTQAAADRFQQKLDYLKQNSQRSAPSQQPTILREDEINAYFAAGRVKLPQGLEKIVFAISTGNVTSNMQVNFDTLTAHSSNPLLGLFTGTHQVEVKAHGDASGGVVHAHIDSVALDGDVIPRFILEMFVDRMLKPKYPQASLDPTFRLPERIDLVKLGEHQCTVTQK